MHTDALNAVCAAASTPALRILRALNLLRVPQRPEEIAEGLEVCLSVVTHEISKLEAAGIVRTIDGRIHLNVPLSSLFGEPLTPSAKETPCQRERKAFSV